MSIPSRGELLGRIVETVIDDNFGSIHLAAVLQLLALLNWTEQTETEALRCINDLYKNISKEN